MNKELLVKTYNLLKLYIKQNEEDLVIYNEMLKNGISNTELNDFARKMQPAVDNFYALKPIYFAYRDNPTKELEEEIISRFGKDLGYITKDEVNEEKENPEKSTSPSTDTKGELEFPVVDAIPGVDGKTDDEYFNEVFKSFREAKTEEETLEFPKLDNNEEEKAEEFPKLDVYTEEKKEKLPQTNSFSSPTERVYNRRYKGKDRSKLGRVRGFIKNIADKFRVTDDVEPISRKEEIRTIREWEAIYEIKIVDPTGFISKDGNFSYETKMNENDFVTRMLDSTVEAMDKGFTLRR